MPASDTDASNRANSGIQTTATGDRHIPQSVRADGSVRKEIKIRPGYRPPEDVEVYKNRTAESWKNKAQGGIPGAEGLKEMSSSQMSGASAKNAKRKEARKKAKAAVGNGGEDSDAANDKPEEPTASQAPSQSEQDEPTVPDVSAEEAEKEKQARNLKKKLRQARELKEKKESGESLLPEQFAKVIKIQELTRQLNALGFDEDDEKGVGKEG